MCVETIVRPCVDFSLVLKVLHLFYTYFFYLLKRVLKHFISKLMTECNHSNSMYHWTLHHGCIDTCLLFSCPLSSKAIIFVQVNFCLYCVSFIVLFYKYVDRYVHNAILLNRVNGIQIGHSRIVHVLYKCVFFIFKECLKESAGYHISLAHGMTYLSGVREWWASKTLKKGRRCGV